MPRFFRYLSLLLLTTLILSSVTGCCTRKSGKIGKSGGTKNEIVANSRENSTKEKMQVSSSRSDELNTGDSRVDQMRRRKTEHYRRLEYAHSLLLGSDPQSALRELERLQMDIRDDLYLEMQTWYLSAMIYHKLGKSSRRKRSMRKMLETMEALQKEPGFKEALEDGNISQEVIQMAIGKAGEKYAE